MATKAFVAKHGLEIGSTVAFGSNAKLHANNVITNGTIKNEHLIDHGNPTGTFGSGSKVPVITVDSKGRITNISNADVAGVSSTSWTPANNTFRISTADGSVFDTVIGSFVTVANADAKYATWTSLTSTNSSIRTLVNNNLANTNAEIDLLNTNLTSTNSSIRTLVNNNLANTNAEIDLLNTNLTDTNTSIRTLVNNNLANTNAEIDLLNTNLTGTNTAIRSLVSDVDGRVDLINTNLTGTNTSIRTLINNNLANTNAEIDLLNTNLTDTNTSIRTLVNSNLANTNAEIDNLNTNLTGTNTALRLLISDRIQVANADAKYATWTSLTSTNTAIRNYVDAEVAALVNSAPATLDTLNELAAALGDDPNFATTISTNIGQKLGATASITLNGDVSGSGSFSANAVTITTTVADDSHNHVISNVDGLSAFLANTNAEVDLLNTNLTGTNTAIRSLVSDVDSRVDLVNTNLTGTNTAIRTLVNNNLANTNAEIDLLNTNLTGTNTAVRTLAINLANARLGATATVQISGDVAGSASFSGNSVNVAVTQQNNSVDLGTHTTGDYVATITAGAGIDTTGGATGEGTSHSISIESDLRGDAWIIGLDTNDYYQVTSTTHDWYLDGVLDMRLDNSGNLDVDGDITAFSATTSSDAKLKDNIETVESAINKLDQIRGVEFTWKKNGEKSSGVIAQEIEGIFPHLVKETNNLNDEGTHKVVNYDGLIAYLIEAVKTLNAKVKELEEK